MTVLWPELLAASVGAAGLGAMAFHSGPALRHYQVSFPTDLTADQVEGLVRFASAVRQGPVSMTVRAEFGGISFQVAAPPAAAHSLVAAASGILPGVPLRGSRAPNDRERSIECKLGGPRCLAGSLAAAPNG